MVFFIDNTYSNCKLLKTVSSAIFWSFLNKTFVELCFKSGIVAGVVEVAVSGKCVIYFLHF